MEVQIVNDSAKGAYGGIDIVVKFSNAESCNVRLRTQAVSLISRKYGKLDVYDTKPHGLDRKDGYEIPAYSFVDAHFNFNNADSVSDGDKLEVTIANLSKTTFEKINDSWVIIDHEDNSVRESEIVSCIEHFETIEEKIGIALQNFSVNICSTNSFSLFFEVLSVNSATSKSFTIEVAVYDKSGKIRCMKSIGKSGDFLGFEVFAYDNINVPVSEIGKIRIYPTI